MSLETVDILDPAAPLADQISTFVESDALMALLDAFELPVPTGPLAARLEQLEAMSSVWDFRGGGERNSIEASDLSAHVTSVVLDAANALGLESRRRPRHHRYDDVLILGGLLRACFSRPAFASDLIASGATETDRIIALGGFRDLTGNEFELASELGHPHLRDEFQAMDAGVRAAFELGDESESDEGKDLPEIGASWRIRTLRTTPSPAIRVVAAPSTEPGSRRPNTADTYKWFAERLTTLGPDARVLLVTSAIYVPYQHADALRMLHLPYGASVDTIGVPTTQLPKPLQQTFGPQHYLQEVRSMIRSYRQLNAALPSRSA